MSRPPEPAELIEAIHHDRLARLDHPEVRAVCHGIGNRVVVETDAVIGRLAAAGIEARPVGDPSAPAQRHAATVAVANGAAALRAADVLTAGGYRVWEPLEGPAGAVHRRFRRRLTLARTTDLTMVLTLEWPPAPTVAGGLASRIPEALIPNENDFDLIPLPSVLWPLYFLVRPVRLLVGRLRGRPGGSHSLGPFLSTPADLIDPLLDLVDVGPDDVLVDLGCGDGRVLRQAVSSRGCRAVGVESNPMLVTDARRAAVDAGLGDMIQIVEGDAAGPELPAASGSGTVFFVFVPAAAAGELVAGLLGRVEPGTRIVAHEQHPLPTPPPGATSVPLLADQGVTVAHVWRA